jgi:hypothetical protein
MHSSIFLIYFLDLLSSLLQANLANWGGFVFLTKKTGMKEYESEMRSAISIWNLHFHVSYILIIAGRIM